MMLLNANNEVPDTIKEMKSIEIHNVEMVDGEELRLALPQQVMLVKTEDETCNEEIDDKSKMFGTVGNNSATSTKTCSKHPSTGAISMIQTKEGQIYSGISGLRISHRNSMQKIDE